MNADDLGSRRSSLEPDATMSSPTTCSAMAARACRRARRASSDYADQLACACSTGWASRGPPGRPFHGCAGGAGIRAGAPGSGLAACGAERGLSPRAGAAVGGRGARRRARKGRASGRHRRHDRALVRRTGAGRTLDGRQPRTRAPAGVRSTRAATQRTYRLFATADEAHRGRLPQLARCRPVHDRRAATPTRRPRCRAAWRPRRRTDAA